MTALIVRLALEYLAGRISAKDPAAVVALVAQLGRLITPEEIAKLWGAVTRAADAIEVHLKTSPSATHAEFERVVSDGGLAGDLDLPPAQPSRATDQTDPTRGEG